MKRLIIKGKIIGHRHWPSATTEVKYKRTDNSKRKGPRKRSGTFWDISKTHERECDSLAW